ncbi:MAG: helix-turn-helix domain-containing protein [Bacteroidia bacterium]|nr:TetR/AcrR family transcriptional regulator [Bacteroidia bacterium]MDW8134906.1 helix-turn-helix domain-containing protein [Bacteroidia bacterium]
MSTPQRIKEAALREFAQYGYEGARLERIARAAGVHTAQIHYYFRNKRGLYEAVQSALKPPSLEEVLVPLQEINKPLPDRLQDFYERFYAVVQELAFREDRLPLMPSLFLSPKPLELPEWVEALKGAQHYGLIRPMPIRFILAQQWGIALLPVWYNEPRDTWEKYYREEAPRLFWESVKRV